MKEARKYIGEPSEDRDMVFVQRVDGEVERLRHHVRHSPTGFAWGYSGSGPSDLARSILIDALEYDPPPQIYMSFRDRTLARVPMEKPFEFTRDEIVEHVRQILLTLGVVCGKCLDVGTLNYREGPYRGEPTPFCDCVSGQRAQRDHVDIMDRYEEPRS